MHVDEHTIEVAGEPVFYRRAPSGASTWGGSRVQGDNPPALYLHSIPTSSEDWIAFLQRTGGLAPDLFGFGRSSKAGHLEYTLASYVKFVHAFLTTVGIERVALVGHGWGAAIGLAFAQRHPERVQRIVIIDAVPLLEGFRWPALVRHWRTPVIGELLMGSVGQRRLARTLRAGAAQPDAWPDHRLEAVWSQFDQGTQRALLRLHRSTDPAGLARAGAGLAQLDTPALVVWGELDPWLEPSFADAYAGRLQHASLERVAGAGHWPWLERPAVIERVAAFLGEGERPGSRAAPE